MTRTITERRVFRLKETNEICFVRDKYARPPLPEAFSMEQDVGVAQWFGGSGIVVINEIRKGTWLEAISLKKPIKLCGSLMNYRVFVGSGEKCLRNVDEAFFFVSLPIEITNVSRRQAQLDALANWVYEAFIERERKEFDAKAKENWKQQLKDFPARLPHEPAEVDHHENQRAVVIALLRQQWSNLFSAKAALQAATSADEKRDAKGKVWLAYIADYKALVGQRPAVNKQEFLRALMDEPSHDYYVHLMSQTLKASRGVIDKVNWQLANGWIARGYYRMSEKKLELAFAQDWNYKPGQYKGNTLAKRARSIGLITALKRGRPEKHVFQDSGVEIRTT